MTQVEVIDTLDTLVERHRARLRDNGDWRDRSACIFLPPRYAEVLVDHVRRFAASGEAARPPTHYRDCRIYQLDVDEPVLLSYWELSMAVDDSDGRRHGLRPSDPDDD